MDSDYVCIYTKTRIFENFAVQKQKDGPRIGVYFLILNKKCIVFSKKRKSKLRTMVISERGSYLIQLEAILRRKANRIGHILRRNCLLHDTIEGQMMEVQ